MKGPENAPSEQVNPPSLCSFPPWGAPPPTTPTGRKASHGSDAPLWGQVLAPLQVSGRTGPPYVDLEPAPSLPPPPPYLLCASPTSPMRR